MDLEDRLRAAMAAAVDGQQPPGNLTALVRRRHRRHVLRTSVAGAAAVAVVAVLIPVGAKLLSYLPRTAEEQSPAASTVYVEFQDKLTSTVVPISAPTSRPGRPIRVGGSLAVAPDGATLYASSGAETIPISTATNQPGQPIHVSGYLTVDPNGEIAYAAGPFGGKLTPVDLASDKPGQPIHTGCGDVGTIAFTPDGKTAYVSCSTIGPGRVIPVNTATGQLGKPVQVSAGGREIAITPDGKTAYVLGEDAVTPINTATNTAGRPIPLRANATAMIAISPDGKTAYVGTTGTVIPISTATNTPGQPIHIGTGVPAEEMVFTPDGQTLYVANSEGAAGRVVPISTATNTPGKPIFVGTAVLITITPDGKTVYAAAQNKVVPISTTTNRVGQPIRLPYGLPGWIVAAP